MAPLRPALAAPTLVLRVELAPGTPTTIDSGSAFRFRLTYECSGSLASDICTNMLVTTDPLPVVFEELQVVGNSDVTLAEYDPATRRATWKFRSPLPPGTTGQLEFEVRFVPGITLDGTSGSITAHISADGRTPVSSSSPTVTANAQDLSTVTKTLSGGGAAGDESVYRVNVCAGGPGGLDFRTVTVTDTLPLGATYLWSNPPATEVITSASPQVVVWSNIANIPAGGCSSYSVGVSYPEPANAAGQSKLNTAVVSGTPFGGVVKTITSSVSHTLTDPNPNIELEKSADADTIVGGTIVTRLRVRNTGNVGLQNVVLEDPIPPEHDLRSLDTGEAVAVEYQKNGDPVWHSGVVTGTGVLVNGTNFPGLEPGDYVSALRFVLGDIPVGFDSDAIRLRSEAVNPPNGGGAAYALPHNVTNTATVRAEHGGTPLTDQQDGATTEIDVPKARPSPQKAIVSGSPALPGDVVRYRLSMSNGSFRELDEPVVADLLPAALEYLPGSWSYESPLASCAAEPSFQEVADYNGSGRTLLIWSWAGTGCSIPSGESARITFDVRVKPGTYPTSALPNRFALVNYSTPASLVRTQQCAAAPAEASLFTTDAALGVDATKLCFSPPSNLRVIAAASLASAKQVRGQLDAGFHRDPQVGATVRGGLITYSLALTNTGNVDFRSLQIIDILPYNEPAPGNLGVRDLLPLGTEWTPQLAGPVTITPAIPGLTVRYSTETNPCRPELVDPNPGCTPMVDGDDPGPGIWSLNLPSDPTAVRSLKFDFGSYVLRANEHVAFTFPMFAPVDAPIATAGDDGTFGTNDDGGVAWNTFAYSAVRQDDGTQLIAQPPRVGIEVQPTPPGRASLGDYVWNDVDQDGVQDEPAFRGVNGVTIRLYEDADGNPATTSDQTLVGVTITRNDSGGNPGFYLFPALEPGFYFVEIVPPAGYTLTTQSAPGATAATDSDA
ncbi:MAG: SdrD B-like domain-containing protein, partial [Chloroflexota bacterium]